MHLGAFESARLKIERSQQHMREFDAELASFFRSGGFTIEIVVDTDEEFVRVIAVDALPARFALILGDTLHNLRSALDIAWFGIFGSDSRKPRSESFLTFSDRGDLEKRLLDASVLPSITRFGGTLLEVVQPYKGGAGEDIRALHELDILDKHRLLIPQVQKATIYGLWVEDSECKRMGINKRDFSEGRPLILKRAGSRGLRVINEGTCHATVVFGRDSSLSGRVVTVCCDHLAKVVMQAIQTLEDFHKGLRRVLST